MKRNIFALVVAGVLFAAIIGFACNQTAQAGTTYSLKHIKYGYRNDVPGNDAWVSWLNTNGFICIKFFAGNASTEDFSSIDLIIIGEDTILSWSDSNNTFAIKHANLPVVAIGQGGQTYLQQTGAASGLYPRYSPSMDQIHVEQSASAIYNLPNVITIPTDKNITVQSSSPGGKSVSIVDLPGNVTVLASDPANMDYASITFEDARYTLWGFDTGNPNTLTDTGSKLLKNVIWNALGGYPVPELDGIFAVSASMLIVTITVVVSVRNGRECAE